MGKTLRRHNFRHNAIARVCLRGRMNGIEDRDTVPMTTARAFHSKFRFLPPSVSQENQENLLSSYNQYFFAFFTLDRFVSNCGVWN